MRPDLNYRAHADKAILEATRRLVDAGYGKEESARALAHAAVINWALVDERPIDELIDELRAVLSEGP